MTTVEISSTLAPVDADPAAAPLTSQSAIHAPVADAAVSGVPSGGSHPETLEAQPVETGAEDSACFVPPPSMIFGSDPFNIGELETTRNWEKPVFNQEYVGTHMNDLMRFFCILRDVFRECMQRIDKKEFYSPKWKNQLDFCHSILEYRTVLLTILNFYEAELNSNLEKIRQEMAVDKKTLRDVPTLPFDGTEPVVTAKKSFADMEENFKIFGLMNQLEDGMVNHLTGIMDRWSRGDLHKREAIQELLRKAHILD